MRTDLDHGRAGLDCWSPGLGLALHTLLVPQLLQSHLSPSHGLKLQGEKLIRIRGSQGGERDSPH